MSEVETLMKEYKSLVESDAQLRYAWNAIKRYKSNEPIDAEDDRKTRHKRNIIAVDDNLKINYEMVKTAPGTFIESSLSASKNKASKEKAWKVAKTKTNYYKKRLSNMNEQFLAEQFDSNGPNGSPTNPTESSVSSSDVDSAYSLEQQTEWLSGLHRDLIQEYSLLVAEEKKWFLKKEILLDANVKLDLYATRDEDQGIELQPTTADVSEMSVFPV
ncbi:LAFA_0A05446g1_1 [Lachancea sp. 'fantastica']|nr:LAFA_0A05446g1_1 [Lachancea sp. 'fantastica']